MTYNDLKCLLMTYISKIFRNFASSNKNIINTTQMQNNSNNLRTYGRMELATIYFPQLQQKCAWQKLKSWLRINPRLRHLADITRRTFTPAEVTLIYAELGEP